MSAVTVDMLVASDAAASGLSHSHADARPATADDDEDSFEQLFEQLRVMKGLVTVLFCYQSYHRGALSDSSI